MRACSAHRAVFREIEYPLQSLNGLRVGFLAHRAFEEGQNRAFEGREGGNGCGCDVTRSETDESKYYTSKTP